MKINKPAIRSPKFQVSLMAGAIVGAAVLAIVAITVREVFFEKYVHETFPPITTNISERAEHLLQFPPPATAQPISANEVDALYDFYLQNQKFDPKGRLAAQLFATNSEHTFERCCRTLVIGDYDQRRRALRMLSFANINQHPTEIRRLLDYARRKAERRSEDDLVSVADQLLAQIPQGTTP